MKHFSLFLKGWISRNKILTFILLLSAVLRIGGIYPSFPPTHPDETAIYGAAAKMIRYASYDPMRYDYGALPMILNALFGFIINPFFIIYSFIFAPEHLPKFKNIVDFFQQMVWQNQQITVLYWSRFLTSIFGVGIVFMVYQVSMKYFNKKVVGLIAAFLTAVNYRQVLNSHMALPDIYNAFFFLVAFYVFANLFKEPSKKNYILSGIAVGLSLSVKFSPFTILPFILVHLVNIWFLIEKHSFQNIFKNRKKLFINLFQWNFILGLLLIPIVFVVINPYIFSNWAEFTAINHYSALQYRMGTNSLHVFSLSYLYHTGIGQIISILIVLGLFWGLKKYTTYTLIFLSTILPFFYIMIYYGHGGFYTRNFVTITPLLLIFAGLFLVDTSLQLGKYLKVKENKINFLLLIFIIVISLGQIKSSITTTYYFSQPQNYRVANLWAQNNIPTGSTVAIRTSDKLPKSKQFKIVNYEYNEVYSLAEMQEKKIGYGYVTMDELSLFFYWWMNQDSKQGLVFWNKNVPDSISQNMFASKVANELATWSIASFIKPWQAPDLNYLIVKIPPKIELTKKNLIKEFSFNKKDDLSSWFLINGYEDVTESITIDESMGHTNKGSVRLGPMPVFPNLKRAVSPIIPLKNYNKTLAYEIKVWVKTGTLLKEREKDGYLEVDFYENDPKEISLTSKSLDAALSERVYGTDEWVEKIITVVAPKNAKFMTVSFRANEHKTPIWFDDVTISESEDIFEDSRANAPYLNYYKIPENILFPVSHGNF